MNLDSLKEVVSNKQLWGTKDFRHLKTQLAHAAISAVENFAPISPTSLQNNPIQLIDFFCGAGGTSVGFSSLNNIFPVFNMLGGCDINKVSASSYSHNFGTPLINRDITDLAYEEGELESLLDSIGYNPNLPTILIGCAPCQGFTSHRKKHWAEGDDGRNTLILAFAEIVKKVNPDAIIMENVPEFLSKKYWNYFSMAKDIYEKLGYTVKQCIYNAASFGVPQDRFRTIVIGMKHDFALPSGLLQPSEYQTVRKAIGSLMPLQPGQSDPNDPLHVATIHKQSTLETIKQVPHDGGNRPQGVGPSCLDRTRGFSDSYGRLYWDRPSITITASARNPASGRFSHPEQDRVITTREAAILQSFPRYFEFLGGACDITRQIGEAVPPLLAAGIAANLVIELVSAPPSVEQLSQSPVSITTPVSSSYSSVIAGIKHKGKVKK